MLVDELSTAKRDRPNEGLGWTVPILAEEIIAMCKRWNVQPQGVADDAIFAKSGHGAGSIADEFSRAGVYFDPAKKADRLTGWAIMRRLLQDAGKPDVPGLYISRGCEYFWETLTLAAIKNGLRMWTAKVQTMPPMLCAMDACGNGCKPG